MKTKTEKEFKDEEENRLEKVIEGFSVFLALLTSGIMFLILFNEKSITLISNIIISISILGFTVELSNLKKGNKGSNYLSDFNAGVSLMLALYWFWNITQGFQNSSQWLIYVFIFLTMVSLYAVYRGLIGLLSIVVNSNSKALNIEIFIQFGGLLVGLLALFISS